MRLRGRRGVQLGICFCEETEQWQCNRLDQYCTLMMFPAVPLTCGLPQYTKKNLAHSGSGKK